jgi:hypothetical protein
MIGLGRGWEHRAREQAAKRIADKNIEWVNVLKKEKGQK